MNMKRILSFLITILIIFNLSACGSSDVVKNNENVNKKKFISLFKKKDKDKK